MKFTGYTVFENVKTVLFVILLIVFCVLAWLVLSVIAGQVVYQEPGYTNVAILPTRLIGSH